MCDAHDDLAPFPAPPPPARRWTRRHFVGALAAGAGIAALGTSPLGRGLVEATSSQPRSLDGPGEALQTAERLALRPGDPGPVPEGKLIFPVDPASDCYVLDNFGDARGSSRLHEGVDITGSRGQPVFAVAAGILTQRYTNTGTAGWGWTLYDPIAERQYKYFHLGEDDMGLEEGDRVELGDVLGEVGKSGTFGVDNYHLHFEVRLGSSWPTQPIDPLPLLHVNTDVCGVSGPMRA